jgi:hypothetical protein
VIVQQTQYRLNLETLLRPVIDAESDLQLILNDPTTLQGGAILEKIRQRLPDLQVSEACIIIIGNMEKILDDLLKLLHTKNGEVCLVFFASRAFSDSLPQP